MNAFEITSKKKKCSWYQKEKIFSNEYKPYSCEGRCWLLKDISNTGFYALKIGKMIRYLLPENYKYASKSWIGTLLLNMKHKWIKQVKYFEYMCDKIYASTPCLCRYFICSVVYLWQVHSFLQSEFSTVCNLKLPLLVSNFLSFP
jgi:hypothetical protein